MENTKAADFRVLKSTGRCYGIYFALQGRGFICLALERGFLWRFQFIPPSGYTHGYKEAVFGLRHKIFGISLYNGFCQADEILPVYSGSDKLRISIHLQRSGVHYGRMSQTVNLGNLSGVSENLSNDHNDDESYYD